MQATARILDLTRYRKRREAQRQAELMWAMYSARANLVTWAAMHANPCPDVAKVWP
ncbi:hypothetical protein IFR09_01705 [Pseudomonas syringae]|nr:hypothetical protein [Pseudomonas syringae]MBD8573038.1 hypothetical protein [Pseudomonas syringae]MBD8790451.1 hypothetical protein [Pseudomonas syringae]MBD8799051.1 hypothetical protein [Pseudomonas syringae]MBD8809877.1 hypothetical protein [Pseudomonas syringae]